MLRQQKYISQETGLHVSRVKTQMKPKPNI